jgi:hypothetical protein
MSETELAGCVPQRVSVATIASPSDRGDERSYGGVAGHCIAWSKGSQ